MKILDSTSLLPPSPQHRCYKTWLPLAVTSPVSTKKLMATSDACTPLDTWSSAMPAPSPTMTVEDSRLMTASKNKKEKIIIAYPHVVFCSVFYSLLASWMVTVAESPVVTQTEPNSLKWSVNVSFVSSRIWSFKMVTGKVTWNCCANMVMFLLTAT